MVSHRSWDWEHIINEILFPPDPDIPEKSQRCVFGNDGYYQQQKNHTPHIKQCTPQQGQHGFFSPSARPGLAVSGLCQFCWYLCSTSTAPIASPGTSERPNEAQSECSCAQRDAALTQLVAHQLLSQWILRIDCSSCGSVASRLHCVATGPGTDLAELI